jgi:hypothetical protein
VEQVSEKNYLRCFRHSHGGTAWACLSVVNSLTCQDLLSRTVLSQAGEISPDTVSKKPYIPGAERCARHVLLRMQL